MNYNNTKRVFLIGHPGAGKALVGKRLAEKLGWQFIDADLGLEAKIGRYLSQIVGKPHGVETFLECQTEILNYQLQKENVVVNTDASLLAVEKNRKLISSEFVVYLKVNTPTQIERTLRNADHLLPHAAYKEFLDSLHNERDTIYENAASLIIDTNDNELDKHVQEIVSSLSISNIPTDVTLERKDYILFHKKSHKIIYLPEQQARCLKLLSQGKSSKDIAKKLNISPRTVEEYIAKTIEQLGCSSSKELIALYHDQP